ncbi:MAG: hypothetical protein PHC34_14260 [Candidatus Gastranaerophilales bacterium]|nr:hypothetical protein [Candidatus Gastranaerophilales bacterium]
MAKETVQAVRQAELNAVQLENEALQKKEAMLSESMQNAKVMISSMTKEAIKLAEEKITNANAQGAQIMEAARQKAEKEVLLMGEIVRNKEQAAVEQVLYSII